MSLAFIKFLKAIILIVIPLAGVVYSSFPEYRKAAKIACCICVGITVFMFCWLLLMAGIALLLDF